MEQVGSDQQCNSKMVERLEAAAAAAAANELGPIEVVIVFLAYYMMSMEEPLPRTHGSIATMVMARYHHMVCATMTFPRLHGPLATMKVSRLCHLTSAACTFRPFGWLL